MGKFLDRQGLGSPSRNVDFQCHVELLRKDSPLGHKEAEAWRSLPAEQRLGPPYREMFKAAGWQFDASIFDVMRCPCCPKDAKPDPDKAALNAGLVEILGDDENGITATMEDFGV
jgi:hypothetical protein